MDAENHAITLRFEMGTPKLADAVFQALKPEVNISQKTGVKASIDIDGSVLTLCFEAKGIARLRAVTNSYLRWIATIIDTIEENTGPRAHNAGQVSTP